MYRPVEVEVPGLSLLIKMVGGLRPLRETEESREDEQSEERAREKCRAGETPVIPGASGSEARAGNLPVRETGEWPSHQLHLLLRH